MTAPRSHLIVFGEVPEADRAIYVQVVESYGYDESTVVRVNTGQADYLVRTINWLTRSWCHVQFGDVETFLCDQGYSTDEAMGRCRRILGDALYKTMEIDTRRVAFALTTSEAPVLIQQVVGYIDRYFTGIGGVILSQYEHRIARELVADRT